MRKFVFGFAFGMAMSGFAALVDGTAYTLGVGETDSFTGTGAIPQFTIDGAFTIGANSTLTISPATDKTSLLATGAGISATLNLEAGATLDIQAYNKNNSNQALALGNLGGTGTVNVANGAFSVPEAPSFPFGETKNSPTTASLAVSFPKSDALSVAAAPKIVPINAAFNNNLFKLRIAFPFSSIKA